MDRVTPVSPHNDPLAVLKEVVGTGGKTPVAVAQEGSGSCCTSPCWVSGVWGIQEKGLCFLYSGKRPFMSLDSVLLMVSEYQPHRDIQGSSAWHRAGDPFLQACEGVLLANRWVVSSVG